MLHVSIEIKRYYQKLLVGVDSSLWNLFSDFGVSLALIILTQNLNYVWDCRPLHLWIFNWKEIYLGGFVLEGWDDLQQYHQDLKYQSVSASAASILLRGCLFLLFPLELYSVIWALINPEKKRLEKITMTVLQKKYIFWYFFNNWNLHDFVSGQNHTIRISQFHCRKMIY